VENLYEEGRIEVHKSIKTRTIMKTGLLFLFLFMLNKSIQAKESSFLRIRYKVVTTYLNQHPNAKNVHQINRDDTLYHVYFIEYDREVVLDITAEGKLLFKQKELLFGEIPVGIREHFLEQEEQYQYGAMLETEDGRIFYFLHFQEEGGLSECLFNADGELIKRDYI
jgi:hypothetical protein